MPAYVLKASVGKTAEGSNPSASAAGPRQFLRFEGPS